MTETRMTSTVPIGAPIQWVLGTSACAERWGRSPANEKTVVAPRAADPSETGLRDSMAESAQAAWRYSGERRARTAFGRRVLELRARIIAANEPLLGWEELRQEVRERRAEVTGEDG